MEQNLRHFSAAHIHQLLTWDAAVDSQVQAFASLANGEGSLAPRGLLQYRGGTAFSYLARASSDGWPVIKVGSVNAGNPSLGLPSVHAYVFVLDRETGALCATADGEAITLVRTPAASVAALELMGDGPERPGAIAIVGSGRQGLAHRELLASRFPDRELRMLPGREQNAIRAGLQGSSTVILATASHTPVLEADWLDAGSMVVSIGAFAPDRLEFGPDLIARAGAILVDDAGTAMRQCGPVVSAIESGRLSDEAVVSIGNVITGLQSRPHVEREGISLFASVGLGIQDAAVIDRIMEHQSE